MDLNFTLILVDMPVDLVIRFVVGLCVMYSEVSAAGWFTWGFDGLSGGWLVVLVGGNC